VKTGCAAADDRSQQHEANVQSSADGHRMVSGSQRQIHGIVLSPRGKCPRYRDNGFTLTLEPCVCYFFWSDLM